MTGDEDFKEAMLDMMANKQIYFHSIKEEDELDKLHSRWVTLIRNNASLLIQSISVDKMPHPNLFDIANEIDAFFIALKHKK